MKLAQTPATIAGLASLLKQVDLDLSADELADLLWLAMQIGSESVASEQAASQPASQVVVEESKTAAPPPPPPSDATAAVYTSPPKPQSSSNALPVLPFRAPAAPALPNQLALARALRPLMRKVPSRISVVLDEEATVVQTAEKKVWTPVFCPAPERWLELAIVIEEAKSLPIWAETIAEFVQLMERQGAFRDVRTWYLQTTGESLQLSAGKKGHTRRSRSPRELLDSSKRRLILVVSDCISPAWRTGRIKPLLDQWAEQASVTVLQLFPEPLWERSALGAGIAVGLSADAPGWANVHLHIDELPGWLEVDPATELKLPVVTLEPKPLQRWARVVAGRRQSKTAGVVLDDALIAVQLGEGEDGEQAGEPLSLTTESLTAEERVNRFWATASLSARRLAGLMAATQVSLPIVHLIQRELMPGEASPVHVAEVLMSGLLYPAGADASDTVSYEFYEGVRPALNAATGRSETLAVLEEVILNQLSQFIEAKTGTAISSFAAFLAYASDETNQTIQQDIKPIAQITRQVLRQLGGDYAKLADQMGQAPTVPFPPGTEPVAFPPLQEFEFETARLEFGETELLEPFEFELATVEIQRLRRRTKVVIQKERRQVMGYMQPLNEAVQLEMVSLPAGSFWMGSPEDEPEREDNESPQHKVKVPAFFMGKYPVTQAQWQVVAGLPQVERALESDPSKFKGADRPVEQVSWLDAVEFCARLSQLTGKEYRLPTEAEWEYACRAVTTTPFHFGETILPDLANYEWSKTYNNSNVTKEKDFRGTTPVGQFGGANAFGLYDMHGNVWEWCADQWHSNYEGAPTDGSAWMDETPSEPASYVLRGGSWYFDPRYCRSATRYCDEAGFRYYGIGFRVSCSASSTLYGQNW